MIKASFIESSSTRLTGSARFDQVTPTPSTSFEAIIEQPMLIATGEEKLMRVTKGENTSDLFMAMKE